MKLTRLIDHLIFYKTKKLYLGEVVKTKFTIQKYINPMFSKATKEYEPYTPPRILIAYRKEATYQELFTKQNYMSKDRCLSKFVNDHSWANSTIEQDIFLPKRRITSEFGSKYISKYKVKKYLSIQQTNKNKTSK